MAWPQEPLSEQQSPDRTIMRHRPLRHHCMQCRPAIGRRDSPYGIHTGVCGHILPSEFVSSPGTGQRIASHALPSLTTGSRREALFLAQSQLAPSGGQARGVIVVNPCVPK